MSTLPLVNIESFLLLQPKDANMPLKMLMPDGVIECAANGAMCT